MLLKKLSTIQSACIYSVAIFHAIAVYVVLFQTSISYEVFQACCGAILLGILLLGGEKTVDNFVKMGQTLVQLRWGNNNVKTVAVDTTTTTTVYDAGAKPVSPCTACGTVLEREA